MLRHIWHVRTDRKGSFHMFQAVKLSTSDLIISSLKYKKMNFINMFVWEGIKCFGHVWPQQPPRRHDRLGPPSGWVRVGEGQKFLLTIKLQTPETEQNSDRHQCVCVCVRGVAVVVAVMGYEIKYSMSALFWPPLPPSTLCLGDGGWLAGVEVCPRGEEEEEENRHEA